MIRNDRPDKNVRIVVLTIATLGSFLTPFMGSAVNIALPAIGKEFAMDAVLLTWVATAYLLAAAVFLIPCGRIADLYGRKKVFTYGVLLFTLFSLLIALSQSAMWLIITRIFQGIGSAMIFSTGVAILTSVFPPGSRGKVLGINVAAVYFGLSLGPLLGGILTHNIGWRSVFLINVPVGVIITFLIVWKLKGEWAGARGEKFDLIGSTLYCVMLVPLMYGLSILPEVRGIWLIVLGVLGVAAFRKRESQVPNPIIELRLFKHNTVFAFSNLAALIHYSSTHAVGFLLSLYLQYLRGLTPQGAGLILVTQPAIMSLLSPLAGRLSDRIEPRVVASAGMAMTVIGLCLFVFLEETTALPFILGCLSFIGFGFALFSSPNMNAIMSSVEKKYYGVASATLATMRLGGQVFSMAIASLCMTLFVGNAQILAHSFPQFIRVMHTAFIIFAVFCFGGIFSSLARGKMR